MIVKGEKLNIICDHNGGLEYWCDQCKPIPFNSLSVLRLGQLVYPILLTQEMGEITEAKAAELLGIDIVSLRETKHNAVKEPPMPTEVTPADRDVDMAQYLALAEAASKDWVFTLDSETGSPYVGNAKGFPVLLSETDHEGDIRFAATSRTVGPAAARLVLELQSRLENAEALLTRGLDCTYGPVWEFEARAFLEGK